MEWKPRLSYPGVRRFWPGGQATASPSRQGRLGFYYHSYKANAVATWSPAFSSSTATKLIEAETGVLDLNREEMEIDLLEALARQLLRAEAVASSRIEGLELSHKKLAEAAFDSSSASVTAQSVWGNVRAMDEAIRLGAAAERIRVSDICQIHGSLFSATRLSHIGGQLRTSQNWIGGRGENPWGAEFIPVPEGDVQKLLADLCVFLNRDDVPAVAQAAIAHAQFESIHPFADGNGRVGRCLIHTVLRRRGVALRYVPPISLVLAGTYSAYIRGLTKYRNAELEEWCVVFADAVTRSAWEARRLARGIDALKREWRASAGNPRQDSASVKIIDFLPVHPVFDHRTVVEKLRVSEEAGRLAIDRLSQASVVREITNKKRGRAWEAVGLFRLLDGFERDLAMPRGHSRPTRAAPRPRTQ